MKIKPSDLRNIHSSNCLLSYCMYTEGEKMENPEKPATRRRQTKRKHNTIFVGHHYAQANTNNVHNVNKTVCHGSEETLFIK
jgi:hypothetical protein